MATDTTGETIPWSSQTEDAQVLLGMPSEVFALGRAMAAADEV